LTKKKPRETHLWQTDLSVFEPLLKAGIFERVFVGRARSLVRYTLYLLAFAYPLILVTSGIMFGGLVFWASLAGSMGIFWLVIRKAGYSGNFASWDMSYKTFMGLGGAFIIYLGVIYGLIYIKLWVIPIFGGTLVLVLMVGVWRASKR